MIEFINDDDTEMIKMGFSTDMMLGEFLRVGLIDSISDDYGENVYDMCNNTTAMFGTHLIRVYGNMVETLQVQEGVFGMIGNHTWLLLEDTIIDLSLAQFIKAPKIAFCLKETPEYQAVRTIGFMDWFKEQ